MNDRQIDRLVRRAQPHHTGMVGSLDLSQGGQELLEEIMSTDISPRHTPSIREPVGSEPVGSEPVSLQPVELPPAAAAGPASTSRRRRALIGAAAGIAFIAAVAGPTLAFRGGNRVEVVPGSQYPATPLVASGNPRLLLDSPGWQITHVYESDATEGEMTFTRGKHRLEVNWYSAGRYQSYYSDRLEVSEPAPLNVLGRKGTLFTYGPDDYAVMVPPAGKIFLEVRGQVGDQAAFVAVVGQLRQVPTKDWFAAMPASVVTPDRTASVAAQMLADVPLPSGFHRSTLPSRGTNDYYQYGAAVIGAVSCAWLKDYDTAFAAGDEAAMTAVDQALSTSRQWAVLQRMNPDGDYPEAVWELADLVTRHDSVNGYVSALGCS